MSGSATEVLHRPTQDSTQPSIESGMRTQVSTKAPEPVLVPTHQAPAGPLLTSRSIVELAWGLTLNFSHEQPQRDLGKSFETEFLKMLDGPGASREEKAFLQNLLMAITKTVRNMGFVRENHVAFLDELAINMQDRSETLDGVAGLTEFSKQGLPTKILSFLVGGGAVVASQPTSQAVLLAATAGGIAFSTGITVALKSVREYYRRIEKKKIEANQKTYWLKHFKPDMTGLLYNLYLDVKALLSAYPGYVRDDWSEWDEKLLKEFIDDQILPPDFLYWPAPTKPIETASALSSHKAAKTG
jgi:hypothetical protein